MTMKKEKQTQGVKRWTGLLMVIGAASLIVAAVERKETKPVESVEIEVQPLEGGHYLITKADIPKIIESNFAYALTAMPVGQVEVARLEEVLENDPFIANADAFVDAKNRVHVSVTQRVPMLRIMDNNDLNYYLDREGNRMPLSEHYTARVLVATGNLPPYQADFRKARKTNSLKDVYELALLLETDPFLRALVEQIYVNNRGELVVAPKVGRQTIMLGRFANMEKKLEQLKIFYREGLPYEGWDKYRSFDLRYDNQVVAVKR
jgi:cell division protein FtsQ